MHTVTFMYRVGQNPTTYYGKIIYNSLSDDHDGLDLEVLYTLRKGLSDFGFTCKKINASVISYTNNCMFSYYSEQDRSCFDFYADFTCRNQYYYLRRGNKKIVKYLEQSQRVY
jgi:hypothetical protein